MQYSFSNFKDLSLDIHSANSIFHKVSMFQRVSFRHFNADIIESIKDQKDQKELTKKELKSKLTKQGIVVRLQIPPSYHKRTYWFSDIKKNLFNFVKSNEDIEKKDDEYCYNVTFHIDTQTALQGDTENQQQL